MKPSFITAVVLALFINLAPRCKGEQNSTQSQQHSDNQSAKTGDQQHSNSKTTTSCTHSPEWYKSPEWVLVIVGAVTAFVIGWQSYETQRSVMVSLRPRLVIRGIELVPGADWSASKSDDQAWHIKLTVANSGGSPAKVVESNLTHAKERDFSDGLHILLPTFPPYSKNPLSFGKFGLKAGEHESRTIRIPDEMSSQLGFSKMGKESGMNVARVSIFWFGFLRYKDKSGVNRTTGFGFRCDLSTERFYRMEEPEYNYED